MFSSPVLLLAFVLASPSLWGAIDGQMSMTSALIRLLIAMPAAALMIGALRWVTASYSHSAKPRSPGSRRPKAADEPGERAGV